MNKFIFILITIITLNNCSLNENSRIWENENKKLKNKKNLIKVFDNEKNIISEFNKDLKIDFSSLESNNIINLNQNNFGSQSYQGELNKIGNYKFSKLNQVEQLNFKPIFLNDGIIFFDKKGSIIKYHISNKVLWKKNYYTKSEKKLNPKLSFIIDGKNIIVADNISKVYSLNINTGILNWSKNNNYPFNSEIKKYKDKIFLIDDKNTLRCYKIFDGSECWSLPTGDSLMISSSKYSLIIIGENVIFNNSIGDVTAVDINSGLIIWQLPTQSSSIINETYNFKFSKLVSDKNSIFFSNNKNEFYSINAETGVTNWINKINSNIAPIILGNIILSISDQGYLYVIEKKSGNIIRLTDIYDHYNLQKRKKIRPVGFVVGNKNIYITNTDGRMMIADLNKGKVTKIVKISNNMISEPFIFNKNLFVIRNGSIIGYN